MKSIQVILAIAFVIVLASCVSAPTPQVEDANNSTESATPADNAYKNRAKELITGSTGSGGTASGAVSGGSSVPLASNEEIASSSNSSDTADVSSVPGEMTKEEEAFLNNYLNKLQYMVYYDEKADLNPNVAKTGVNQANRYLLEKMGRSVVDMDQIEKIKQDQMTVYESETGGSIDLIQYIAQKNNADVYVEIAFTANNSESKGKYYASAQGSMKIYDTSTAELMGSVSFQSPQVMSTSSAESAASNAVAASVWNAMPKMIEQSKMLVKNAMSNGIRYEVVIQNTPDSRQISTLRRALSKQFREVSQISYSAGETKIAVFTFKNSDKVEDAIYDAADNAGLLDIYLVYSRGKAFTFNSGL